MTADKRKRFLAGSNKGLSFVEVVMILAIIGVMGGIMLYNVSVTNGYRARKAKNQLASEIAELKVRTLSKAVATGDVYMEIYKKGNTVYSKVHYKEFNTGNPMDEGEVEVGKRIGVTYGKGTTETELEEGTPLIICFNRSTGALVKDNSGTTELSTVEFIKTKVFEKSYAIELVPATGKIVNRTEKQ